MAFVVERKTRKLPLFSIVVFVVIAIAIGSAIYFLLFSRPELIDDAGSSPLRELAEVKFDFAQLRDDPEIGALRAYIDPVDPDPSIIGNPNLFSPPTAGLSTFDGGLGNFGLELNSSPLLQAP